MFRQLFDPESSTYTYLIADSNEKTAVLIDPVLEQTERDLKLLEELGIKLFATIETHVHADHITGAGVLREKTGSRIIYPEGDDLPLADRLFKPDEVFNLGQRRLRCLHTPGHTANSFSYLLDDTAILTGDALLIRGCGRTDFQQGDARKLYHSNKEILFALPEETLVYPGHDYKGHLVSTIGEEKRFNPRLADKTEAEFVELMNNLNLAYPKKIDQAMPANLRCGILEDS